MHQQGKHFGRRLFLKSAILLLNIKNAFSGFSSAKLSKTNAPTAFLYRETAKPFYHGVASGDPLHDSVIIWTKITTEGDDELIVAWEIAPDPSFQQLLQRGTIKTNEQKDYTVKVDVKRLNPDTYYYYRFIFDGQNSATGRTKTLPVDNVSKVSLIVVSCNAYEAGYFNAYRKIGEKEDRTDAVLHLGDYIYEDYLPKYFEAKGRVPLPEKRCTTLQDYRTRYAQYRLDANLQTAHQMHPFIHIWDDHEIANDAYADGAAGHKPDLDGPFLSRKQNALQAFHEWVPIRSDQPNCNRAFSFGNLVDLFMLDERTERTEEKSAIDIQFNDSSREMISKKQLNWLTDGLKNSDKNWKLIGNQVLFSAMDISQTFPVAADRKLDNWSGYPIQQKELLSFLKKHSIKNTVLVSGDSHCSWAFNITDFPTIQNKADTKSCAVEIGIPAISSSTWGDSYPPEKIKQWEALLLKNNPHLKYVSLSNHGYVTLVFTKQRVTAHWYAVNKREVFTNKQVLVKSMSVMNNAASLSELL